MVRVLLPCKNSHTQRANLDVLPLLFDLEHSILLSDLVDQYIRNRDDKIIVVKERGENNSGRFEYAYRNNEANKKVLHKGGEFDG